MARERLYRRIEERAASMIEQGLVEEARRLQDLGYGSDLNSLQTVGYKEAFDFLDGYLTRERMTVLIKQKTRNYAKRQITWFRKEKRIQWLDQSDSPDSHSTIAQIGEIFSTSST
jgi:tRNA dimethylallyltransferase